MPVPMCFGRASLVSQKSGLDPGKLLAGHSTRSNPWVHLSRPVAQDAVWGRSPSLRSRILNTRRVSPQGTARAAHKHGALETPWFSQCFPKQTGSVSSDFARANGVRKDFIHSCRSTPSEKSPSQRHLQADLDVALAAWTAQSLFSAASLHKPAPQALVALLLCSPSPSQETCMCKQSQGVFTRLPAPTGHTHTPFSIKQQRQKLKLTQTHATCRKHPPLFCSPPNNHGRNSLSQTQELLYSALMSTDCLIFGLINSELLWYLKGGRKKIELIVTTCT